MYKYHDETFETLDDLVDAIEDRIRDSSEMEDRFIDMSNESYNEGIKIGCCVFDLDYIWRRIDPMGYQFALREYISNYIYDLRSMEATAVLNELSNLGIDVEEVETEETE